MTYEELEKLSDEDLRAIADELGIKRKRLTRAGLMSLIILVEQNIRNLYVQAPELADRFTQKKTQEESEREARDDPTKDIVEFPDVKKLIISGYSPYDQWLKNYFWKRLNDMQEILDELYLFLASRK